MSDVLFVSNGHGEDEVGARVVDALQRLDPTVAVEAWPMVGVGAAYRARGLRLIGAQNRLPSQGFATLDWRLMWRDLQAGWLATHWRQAQFARSLPSRYRLLVAVGDIVPIVAAALGRTPFMFIGAAKSSYYAPGWGYTKLEKLLLRKYCLQAYPRDRLTEIELAAASVANRYVGNPMMDDLDDSGDRFGVATGVVVAAMLAGSRPDAQTNTLDLLSAAAVTAGRAREPLAFVFPAHPGLDLGEVERRVADDVRLERWKIEFADFEQKQGVALRLVGDAGAQAIFVKGRFAEALRIAQVAVGMAGTANEQAIGLGVPLVATPSSGVQGDRYVKMKMKYFGPAAILAPRNDEAIADAVLRILADAPLRARMIAAGRERMGAPGASLAIAEDVRTILRGGRIGPPPIAEETALERAEL